MSLSTRSWIWSGKEHSLVVGECVSHCQIPSRVTGAPTTGRAVLKRNATVSGLKDVPSPTVSEGKQLSGNFREAAHSLSISSLPSSVFSKLSWGGGGWDGVGWGVEERARRYKGYGRTPLSLKTEVFWF